jgi:hypothetical protein
MCRRGNLTAHQPGWLAGWHAEPPIQLSGQGKPGVEATIPTPSHPCKPSHLQTITPTDPLTGFCFIRTEQQACGKGAAPAARHTGRCAWEHIGERFEHIVADWQLRDSPARQLPKESAPSAP